MKFVETPLAGAFVLEAEASRDERGYFARSWDAQELGEHGLCTRWVTSSVSFNEAAGTLRGLHYQEEPHAEIKMVTCTAGAIFDVIVDLRPGSPSYRGWYGAELSADNRRTFYVPVGFAHGFLTLAPRSVAQYHMSEFYHPEFARGVRWDDPAFAIAWPSEPTTMSDRDRHCPDFGGRS